MLDSTCRPLPVRVDLLRSYVDLKVDLHVPVDLLVPVDTIRALPGFSFAVCALVCEPATSWLILSIKILIIRLLFGWETPPPWRHGAKR